MILFLYCRIDQKSLLYCFGWRCMKKILSQQRQTLVWHSDPWERSGQTDAQTPSESLTCHFRCSIMSSTDDGCDKKKAKKETVHAKICHFLATFIPRTLQNVTCVTHKRLRAAVIPFQLTLWWWFRSRRLSHITYSDNNENWCTVEGGERTCVSMQIL